MSDNHQSAMSHCFLLLVSGSEINLNIAVHRADKDQTVPLGARGYKTFIMFNSAENEILNARKYKNIKKFSFFQAQICIKCYFSC